MAALSTAIEWLCLTGALGAIFAYVGALLRNRPHLRPINSLGLLLIGGALLALPTVIGRTIAPERAPYVIYLVLLLDASAVFQAISAFRRRRQRDLDPALAGSGA